eukprot:jgi/Tetstr1/457730/TSEL_044276.t1
MDIDAPAWPPADVAAADEGVIRKGDPGDFYMKVIAKKFRGVWHYGVITGVVTEWVLEDYGGATSGALFSRTVTLWTFCVQRSGKVTVQSGSVMEDCLHHMETVSILNAGPLFEEARVKAIMPEKELASPAVVRSVSRLAVLGHMYKRLQGAAWFVTRWGLQNVVTEEDGPERKAQVDALTMERRTRYPARRQGAAAGAARRQGAAAGAARRQREWDGRGSGCYRPRISPYVIMFIWGGQRFARQPTGSGGAAERPDLLELAQSGRVGAKSVSAEDDYLAVPELLQRAESGYEAVRPVSRVPGLFPLSTDLTNEYLKQDDRRLPAQEEYLWMSCFGAHMAALFVALDELLPYVPSSNQDFTPYLARARNHAEAIDKAFRFRLAFLRKLNEIKRVHAPRRPLLLEWRLQLQVAGVGEDVAADVDAAAKDAFGSDELGQRTLDLLSSSLSAQTLKSYAGRLAQFAEFCHDSENISPLEATTATVVRYVAWIGERGHIAAKSLQPYLSAINTFFELHNLVPIAKDSLHLTSARQSHLDYRALLASVVNFLFFARGLTGVSCRVQDVHVDTYNITLQIYREKGRAGRRGPDDLRVLLLPVSEHPRVARLLRYFIDNVQSVPLGGWATNSDVVLDYIDPNVLPSPGAWFFFGHIAPLRHFQVQQDSAAVAFPVPPS